MISNILRERLAKKIILGMFFVFVTATSHNLLHNSVVRIHTQKYTAKN